MALCDGYDSILNEIYFDRDPYITNMVINYYQTGKLHLNNHSACNSFTQNELNYWQIEEYSFDSCCEFYYFKSLDEIKKIVETEEHILRRLSFKEDFGIRLFPKLREDIWNLFANLDSSIYAKLLYFFSIFIVLVSIVCFGNNFKIFQQK